MEDGWGELGVKLQHMYKMSAGLCEIAEVLQGSRGGSQPVGMLLLF